MRSHEVESNEFFTVLFHKLLQQLGRKLRAGDELVRTFPKPRSSNLFPNCFFFFYCLFARISVVCARYNTRFR